MLEHQLEDLADENKDLRAQISALSQDADFSR
jgi:cell division protein FtsB